MHVCCPPNAHWKASAIRWTPWTIFTYFYRAWFGCGIWRHDLCAAPPAVPSLREPCSILAFSVVLVLNAPTNTWKLRLAPFCQLGAKWCLEVQRINTLDDSIDSLHHEPTWFSYVFHFSIVFNCVPARYRSWHPHADTRRLVLHELRNFSIFVTFVGQENKLVLHWQAYHGVA